jgi:glycosyltransferase involved in cell wall biosynthesis
LRVVHVHRVAGIGGSERHLLVLLPALAERGLDVRFLGLDAPFGEPERLYEQLEEAGVPTFRLPAAGDAAPRLAGRVVRSLRGLRPDLVHTHLVHADLYGGLAAARLRLPLVSTKHNDDPFRTGSLRFVERALAHRTARVIAITEALGRFQVERVGIPEGKVAVVHYGLDTLPAPWGPNAEVELPDDARVLVAVARLAPQKGLDVAVAALPQLLARESRAVLVVLGEGPERAALERQAEALGVGDALRLPGRAGDVSAWLRRAEALVHPARWEGFGLAVLEAMLAGVPVVATRVSSLPELVVDGETGLLVPPDDTAALAAAVSTVLENPAEGARLAEAAGQRARERFSVARMADATLAVYRDALN